MKFEVPSISLYDHSKQPQMHDEHEAQEDGTLRQVPNVLGFSTVFDTVDHEVLIPCLHDLIGKWVCAGPLLTSLSYKGC